MKRSAPSDSDSGTGRATKRASLNGGSPSSRRSGAAHVHAAASSELRSPLVDVMEHGVREHTVVRSPEGSVYTGFADFKTLTESECIFMPMNSNRAVNNDVVEERVQSNLQRMKERGEFFDFGQINFLIIDEVTDKTFYIMDGQHRCLTMGRLVEYGKPINFQFRVKRVKNEKEAAAELDHFQNSYPSDPRSFFPTQRQTALATSCLNMMRESFPSSDLWRPVEVASRVGARTGDPNRPYLTDFVFFGLLKDSKLLDKHFAVEPLMKELIKVDSKLASLGLSGNRSALGKSVSPEMVKKAKSLGCFLGLFRPGKLEWRDIAL
mmetsp:Transcript_10273/g.20155  ORF Transcript_10273/g.20155 Transcript_10273/m.20155 type:complete len:322 (-) Transcript_10273:318-1283(-)|eukprot:CAMPEP_0171492824 /NCGR_PEP_ID=MMETSP0958-20121227/4627_1 /TAXON_ID=87120 /ORGANISM="Aurantiochytrium limacinum, Strain ATCCMYA-1381" /LENGTH=321 /DNA_ID=CAMNT_0012026391 /DNA_START=64 /DNA_END=1029 /DNA_ORIENTATION=+